jgi:hypothetical protein
MTMRPYWYNEQFAEYVMQRIGALAADEHAGPEDLAAAVCFVKDEWFVENALRALEQHYGGANDPPPKVIVLPVQCADEPPEEASAGEAEPPAAER